MPTKGRPVKFKPQYVERAHAMWSAGAIDEEVAKKLKVHPSTLAAWMSRYPELREAKTSAAVAVDDQVEAALFKRATGYEHEDTHFSACEGVVTATPYTKRYPPDTTAGIFWLKNRRPDKWRDRIDIKGAIDVNALCSPVIEAEIIPEPNKPKEIAEASTT